MNKDTLQAYWKANQRLLLIMLFCWFMIGIGLPVLLVHPLNEIHMAGFPLGFWFSLQGSFILFVILAFSYAHFMNKLEKKYEMRESSSANI